MFALAVLLIQAVPALAGPAGLPEQHADLALRRADEGRALAVRFLCQDDGRVRRVRELDERFGKLQESFARSFGHSWREDPGAGTHLDEQLRADLGRKDDCRLRDSFMAGLTDYENGLLAAQVELGTPG